MKIINRENWSLKPYFSSFEYSEADWFFTGRIKYMHVNGVFSSMHIEIGYETTIYVGNKRFSKSGLGWFAKTNEPEYNTIFINSDYFYEKPVITSTIVDCN